MKKVFLSDRCHSHHINVSLLVTCGMHPNATDRSRFSRYQDKIPREQALYDDRSHDLEQLFILNIFCYEMKINHVRWLSKSENAVK
jgi:hypothetical protein